MNNNFWLRPIALLLCIALACTMLPVHAFATEAADVTDENNNVQQEEIVVPDDADNENAEEDEVDIYADAVDVSNSTQLAEALSKESRAIRITADFQLDQTFYVISDTVIFSDSAYTLTRAPGFGGDIFVVGQYEDGTVCENVVTLQMGHDESTVLDLLTIDGNQGSMTADVSGTVFFGCSNSRTLLYPNLTVENCKKVSNERTLDEAYGLSYTEQVGGAVAIIAGGTMDIYGGNYLNNSVNTDADDVSARGGAFYFFGAANIHGGTFSGNSAYRGGAFYVYRTLHIYGGTVKANTATSHGGAIYMPASTQCYLYIQGDIEDQALVYFTDNHAGEYGGALFCQGVLASIDAAVFSGNTADSHGGAAYCIIEGDEDSDPRFTAINTTFRGNTTAATGGAVYLRSSHGYFENVSFDGNHAGSTTYGGGALYSTGSYVEINGAEINNNTSDNYGGALEAHSSSKLVLNNITTSGNYAKSTGGFLFANNSAVELYNSAIKSNSSGGNAGAVYATNNATFHAYITTFENNIAAGNGGALYIYTGAVESLLHSCVFVENSAANFGGGIYVSNASVLNAYNLTAKGNTAAKGGFMYETTGKTSVTLNGLIVESNTATDGGSIIWGNTTAAILYINKTTYLDLDVSTELDDAYWASAIANNLKVNETTDSVPGFVDYGNSEETPPESIVNPNITNVVELQKALSAGLKEITIISDFALDRTFYVISDVTIHISGNRTLTRRPYFGGDLFVIGQNADGTLCEDDVEASFLPMADSSLTIDGNRTNMTENVVGTAFFVCEPGHLELNDGITVTNCNKVGNERTLDEIHGLSYTEQIGGAVAIVAGGTLDIYGGNYYNNLVNDETDSSDVSSRGGAIYAFGNVNIYGGSFTNNHAHRGGAFYVYRTMQIYNAVIQNNSANLGGAVYIPASTVAYLYLGGASGLVESDVKFLSNSATGAGGAIYSYGKLLQVENTQFIGNSAVSHGGAIAAYANAENAEDVKLIVKDSTFRENTTNANGGAVYLNSTCAQIHNTNFISNNSYATNYGGGAVYSTGSYSLFEGVRFTENASTYNGGAMALYSSSEAVLYNVTATGNSATSHGGFLYSNSTSTFYNSSLQSNSSVKNGGALYLTGNAVTNIYATDFVSNQAANGGALHVYTGSVNTLLQDCRFSSNSATGFGGGIYINNASGLYLYDITATGNSAGSGGFMYETTKGSVVTVNGLTVSGNTDTNGGPIIWGNTFNATLNINKANYKDLDAETLDDAYWASALYNKLTIVEITDDIPGYDEYGNENYENLAGYVSVSNADELEKAINDKAKAIRIVSDFMLDRTFYIVSDVTIFSTTPYRLTRAADFAGDIFVVGETADGKSTLVKNMDVKLTLGNPDSDTQDLLVIDGNRNNMTVDVNGSVLFVCHSAQLDIYSNVSIVNAKKTGNARTCLTNYMLSYPTRVGGAAIIVESGTLNLLGGNIRRCGVNQETISEELGENGRISTLGGAIFSLGDVHIYDGDFEFNKAARGGFIYNYRMTHIYGGNFLNNYATVSGGAFCMPNSEYAVIYVGGTSGQTAVTFRDNTAVKNGGAIYASALASTILYGDIIFEGNAANSNGGAIYTAGVVTADNVTFRDNFAYSKGGAVYMTNTSNERVVRQCRFNSCTFEGNSAYQGGAVTTYASNSTMNSGANATFTDCTFTSNSADARANGYGGAIYASYRSSVTLNNTTLQNNTAITEGGALYMGYESKATADSSTFTGNSVGTENNGYGGAISLHSSFLDVTNSQFTGNTAVLRAGAIYISYNSARATDSQVKITGSTFTDNTCASLGGAIYSVDRKLSPGVDEEGNELPKEDDGTLNLVLLSTQFTGNTADSKGGAIYLSNYSHAYMNDVSFTQNKALGEESGHNAGAIYMSGSSSFEINGGSFTENTAGANGGAIGMYTSSSAIMNNITATGNAATSAAGFMICDTAYATIYNSHFENNSAGAQGGVISTVDLATVHIYNSTFSGNTAAGTGGALYIYGGAVNSVIHGCTFTENHSDTNGGVIYASNKSLLEVYHTTAKSNTANKGGFLYETTSATAVTLNGVTVSGNSAVEGGDIIWGNTTSATLYIHKGNYTDTQAEVLDDAYWANAIVNLLTVKEITDPIPEAPTYTDSYISETETPSVTKDEVDVDHIFYLAENGKDGVINATYGALPKLDNSSNFMSLNTTVFPDINGSDVTVDSYVYQKGDTANNCNVGEGLLIYQAMCYKKAHPEEDVKIALSSFRFSVAAAVCLDRDSRYFGYMQPLYGRNYDNYGFVRISYLLICAASMGIDVTVIGQLDGNPKSSADPGFEEYFTDMLDAPCDSSYASGVIGDYMNFQTCHWTSYNNKGGSDMMHTKMCAVSHYLDKDGVTHRNAVWTSSSNLDGINSTATNGVNKLQTATIVSDHAELYRVAANYLDLVSQYCAQEDVYIFRDIVIQRNTDQIDLILADREAEIPADQQIVYLGSENDAVFELYFAPFGGDLNAWDEDHNPFVKQLSNLQNSEGSIILTWNNVKWAAYPLRNQMEDVIIDAFHRNPNPENKIYVNLPLFDELAFSDLTVGEDIGYTSFGAVDSNNIHSKDLQVSYVQNGQRYYVSLFNSMNIHTGSMSYQSNFALVIKETECGEDSVFFTLADKTTEGIVSHAFTDEVLEYIPETMKDGYIYHPCANCDEKQILEIIHRSSDWIAVQEATKEQNGIAYKNCLACGLLLEAREYAYPGETVSLDLSQAVGKTFTTVKDAQNTLETASTPLTIEATVQLHKSVNERGGVIVGNYDNSTQDQFNLEIYTYGRVRLFLLSNGQRTEHVFNTDIRSEDAVHIAVTVDGQTAKLYMNGQLKETAELSLGMPEIAGRLWVGGDNRYGNVQYFRGTIYNVHLFDDVRTEDELARDAVAVFPEEAGLLASKSYIEDQPASEFVKPVGKTFSASSAVYTEALTAAPLTVEAIVQVPTSQVSRAGVIVGNYDGKAAPRLNLEVYDGGKVRLYLHNGITSITCLFPTDIRSNQPVHLAVTVDELLATLYLNGEAVASQTLDFTIPEITGSLRIGGDYRSDNSQYFKGSIYSVNLFDSVRTADQIRNDMILVPAETDGLLYSRFFALENNVNNVETVTGITFTESTPHLVENLSATPRTIEATIQLNPSQTLRGGVVVGNYDSLFHGLMNLEIYTNGRVRLYYSTDDGTRQDCIFDPDIRSDKPVHIAVTIDGLTATLYVNGTAVQTKALSVEPGTATDNYKIGGDNRDGNSQYFKGMICNVSLFGDVRTADEILADMSGAAADTDNLLYTHTFASALAEDPMEILTVGKTFTAETTLSMPQILSATPLTLEAVVQVDESITDRAGVIAGNYDGLFHELMNLEIYSGGRPRLYYAAVDGTRADCTFDTDIRSADPVHIAVTVDGLTANLYVNGVLTEQKALPFEVPVIVKHFKIGHDNRRGNSQYFKGTIYSVSLFSHARTLDQIKQDLICINIADPSLVFSTMFASDMCAKNGHLAGEVITDIANSEYGSGISHTECVVCGQLLQVWKMPSISTVVAQRTYENITGFAPAQAGSGIAVDTLSAAPHTFEATVQLDKDYHQRAGVIIGNYDGSNADQINLEIYTNGRPRLYYKTGGVAYTYLFKSDIRSDSAAHLALTVDGTNASLYINGKLTETAVLTAELPEIVSGFKIGCDNRIGTPQNFAGTIYSVCLYADARTPEQIAVDRYLPPTGNESMLLDKFFTGEE